jgi:hypothetical protein
MDVPPTLKVAIIGCGLAGCGIVTILKDSFANMPSAPAFLVAVDDSDEALGQTMADRKVLLASGGKPDLDLGGYSVAFFVLDPSEAGSLTMAQVLASGASGKKAYTFGFLIKPAGGWQEDDRTVYGSFDASALIDEGRVLEIRNGKDPEYAMRIVLNFIAHVLTFMSEAIRDGKLSTDALYRATYGKVSGFAATSVSQPESLYNMTMSKIDRDMVKSAILFMTEDTDNMLARRIFLSVASGLPRSMEMIALRVKYVEPFRIVALLAM